MFNYRKVVRTQYSSVVRSGGTSSRTEGLAEPGRRQLGLSNVEIIDWNRKMDAWLAVNDPRPVGFCFGNRFK